MSIRFSCALACSLALACAQVSANSPTRQELDSAGRQQKAVKAQETSEQKYARALRRLSQVEPGLDAETKANLPYVREVLKLWADGQELGDGEENLIFALSLANEKRGDSKPLDYSAMKRQIKAALSGMAEQSKTFVFEARESDHRGTKRGVVNMHVEKREATIVTFLTGTNLPSAPRRAGNVSSKTKFLSAPDRAGIVANRMSALAKSNPMWWTEMIVSATPDKSLYYVSTRRAPGQPLVTADQEWAREVQRPPAKLAEELIGSIRSVIGSAAQKRASAPPITAEEKHWAAIRRLQRGDTFSDRKEYDKAESMYAQAVELAPTYLPAYMGLAELYLTRSSAEQAQSDKAKADHNDQEAQQCQQKAQEDKQKANQAIQAALSLPGCAPEDKKFLDLLAQRAQE